MVDMGVGMVWLLAAAAVGALAAARGQRSLGYFVLALCCSAPCGLFAVLRSRNLAAEARLQRLRDLDRRFHPIRMLLNDAAPPALTGAGTRRRPVQLLQADSQVRPPGLPVVTTEPATALARDALRQAA